MKKVGDILRKARQRKCLEYEDVSRETKIHPQYLKALEVGDYDLFSSSVHLKGFLKNYAKFLGLNVDEVLAFFRREYDEAKDEKGLKNVTRPLGTSRFVFTPAILITVSVFFLVLAFFGYLFYEFRQFAGAPLLIIQQPEADKISLQNDVLNIVGKTDPDAVLTINGQRISLGEEGVFSTSITLSAGVNILNFVSKNKLGKESRQTRTVVVEREELRPEKSLPPAEVEPEGLNLEVQVGPNATWLEVIADGKKEFEGLLGVGISKRFRAGEGIRLRTGNAGSTKIIFNGQDRGIVGVEGEVKELVFGSDREEEVSPSGR